MTNRPFRDSSLRLAAVGGLVAAIAGVALLGGCGSEPEPEVVVAPPPPPPPPPPPAITPIETLMAQLGIDARVRLPEELAPDSDPARIAVLTFFDSFARGDQSRLLDMLSGPDQVELERLVDAGTWEDAVEGITRIDVRTGRNNLGDDCALAIFHVGMDFEPQLWTYEIVGVGAEFAAEPTPPGIMNRLSGTDWIAAWYRILADELAKADEPDEQVTVRSVNFDTSESSEGTGGGSPGGPVGPSAPGFPGRRPIGDPIEPPGLRPGGT